MLVELANGVAVNTEHVTQCRIVDCSIRWRLVSDGTVASVGYRPARPVEVESEFPHVCTFDTFDEAAVAYNELIESSGWGS